MKKSVSIRALEQRINRKLAKKYQKLHRSRRGGEFNNLGQYHIVDTYTNTVIDSQITEKQLEGMGRDLECLSGWEKLDGL